MLLGLGRINFNILFWMLSEFLIFGSILPYSFMVEGKNDFLKNTCFIVNSGIASEFRVIYRRLCDEGVVLERSVGV